MKLHLKGARWRSVTLVQGTLLLICSLVEQVAQRGEDGWLLKLQVVDHLLPASQASVLSTAPSQGLGHASDLDAFVCAADSSTDRLTVPLRA